MPIPPTGAAKPWHDCPCGHIHPKGCHAHKSEARGGGPCGAPATTGLTVCYRHGGATPTAKAKSAKAHAQIKAAREVARLGRKVEMHPAEALVDLVHWTAGEVAYWRGIVVELEQQGGHEALTWGVTKVKEGGDDRGTTEQAAPHIAYQMLTSASDRLATYAAAALRAGVQERSIRLAEAQGAAVALAQRTILERMFAAVLQMLRSHGIDDAKIITALEQAWAEAMGVIVPQELRRLGEGNPT